MTKMTVDAEFAHGISRQRGIRGLKSNRKPAGKPLPKLAQEGLYLCVFAVIGGGYAWLAVQFFG